MEKISQENEKRINHMIQNVFLLTLDVQNLGPQSPHSAVQLASYRDLSENTLLDLDNVANPFFERMLMPASALSSNIVKNTCGVVGQQYGSADQADTVAYLGECFIRLQIERRRDPSAEAVLGRLEELIFQNLQLGFQEPDLVFPQTFSKQFLAFYFREFYQHPEHAQIFTQKFLGGNAQDFDAMKAGFEILNLVQEKVKQFKLMRMQDDFEIVIHLLNTLSLVSATAKILMMHSVPNNPREAEASEKSLLGGLLRISCLPEHMDMPSEFFVTTTLAVNPAEVAQTEKFVWTNTTRVTEAMFQIFNNVIRASPELREVFLHWVGDCLSANFGRAKMWQPSERFQIRLASDGFILNLSAVLLRLCRPFFDPVRNPRILKIHPLFPASGTYLRKMPEETTLQPKDASLKVNMPDSFGFITLCFFLCHEALRLGWGVLWDRFTKFGRALNEIESELEEARAAGNVALQQRIEQGIGQLASRHLSMRAALTHPDQMGLMIEFSVCTATWLSQMSVQPANVSVTNLASDYLPLFPVPEEAPPHLQFIPELLVENLSEILTCNSRLPLTTGSSVDWKYEWFEELMNLALIPMLKHNRMKNPHLRAKMAMLMHNMMPHKRMADTYQETRNSLMLGLLDGHKERLFREHPHREYFLPAILEVFVSIEMTGQGLRFGEAFHYRRPLYALMEYLLTIDFHKDRLERLASEAVGTLEATNPPIFLRFLNHLINDSIYLLDEALNTLSKLKTLEVEKESWASLTHEQRAEKEKDFNQQSSMARYLNELGRENVQCLKNLTLFKNPARILLSTVLVDRLAPMLNYFLVCLVKPEKRMQYKVKDLSAYSFEPRDLVTKIINIYVNLARHDARKDFLLAICKDKRSYNPQLFREAQDVLRKINESGQVIDDMDRIAKDVERAEAAENEEEELLMDEDVPEEYLDPIMNHLMRDPVLLPSSGKIVDRSTIARILLSDQSDPFNRQSLTMDLVKPANKLREEIESWIQRRRDTKNQLQK